MMTSMNFPTLPSYYITNSFLQEIWFWGPTYPTFSDTMSLFLLFFNFEIFPNQDFRISTSKITCKQKLKIHVRA